MIARLIAALLCAATLTGCGLHGFEVPSSTRPSAPGPDVLGKQAERMADFLLAVARAARPESGAGWSGGWEPCVSYVGHQVEFRASGSFGARAYGRAPKEAILAAAQSSGWRAARVRIDARHLSFDLIGDGVRGGMVVDDAGVDLQVGTGCVDVSARDAERLTTAGSVDSDR